MNEIIASKSVFVDESGATNLGSVTGKDRFYIAAAVIVETCDIPELTKRLDEISARFNNGAPLKSTKIGADDRRRTRLLKEISTLPFRYCLLVVDKSKLNTSEGLVYKTSFYKFFANLLYRLIDERLVDFTIDLYVDKYGNQEFQTSCMKYFNAKSDLFKRAKLSYNDDKTSRLVQLADIVAGTLRQYLSKEASKEFCSLVRSLLRNAHEVILKQFPFEPRNSSINTFSTNVVSELDMKIGKVNVDRAVDYISTHDSSEDMDDQMRVYVLELLLEALNEETGNIYAEQLQENLSRSFGRPIPKQYIQSKVIGGLRLWGIIIAGEKNGYRLATSEQSLRAYLAHDKAVIMPMLAKLEAARKVMLENVSLDPLVTFKGYADLKRISDTYRELKMDEQDANILKASDEEVECGHD